MQTVLVCKGIVCHPPRGAPAETGIPMIRTRSIRLQPPRNIWFTEAIFLFAFAFTFCASVEAQDGACKSIPSGQDFWIRLSEPVSTYSSKVGTRVTAILIDSPRCGDASVFSTGIGVEGRITYVRRVGLGFRHGSSAIAINFDQLFVSLKPLSIKTQIEEVDNGRETVKAGVIEGASAKDTPQRLMSARLLHLPEWNPDDYWIFMVRRAVFPFSPEPETFLPLGTDLRLKLKAPLQLPADFQSAAREQDSDDEGAIGQEFRAKLLALPNRSVTGAFKPSDPVDLAFLGSPRQIEAAFQAAGWTYGDALSTWSVLREMRAISSLNSYSHLPISRQWLNGEPPDFLFEKSFDSYQKREHIRIWNEDALEDGLWASGAIRETSAEWSLRKGKFIHHVDPNVDAEREKVVRELSLTGCVAHVYHLKRPQTPERLRAASGDVLETDGGMALIQLKDCELPDPTVMQAQAKLLSRPRSRITRFVRTQALSIRDLWQSNAIYESFEISLSVIHSLKNRRLRRRPMKEGAVRAKNVPDGAN
jgi:hypothetical protein